MRLRSTGVAKLGNGPLPCIAAFVRHKRQRQRLRGGGFLNLGTFGRGAAESKSAKFTKIPKRAYFGTKSASPQGPEARV